MKTFKFIVVVLSAISLCTHFASCNNGDEPSIGDNGLVQNEKKLVTIFCEEEAGYTKYKNIYNYDKQGKIFQMSEDNIYNFASYYTCLWSDDFIKIIDSQNYFTLHEIKDGLVQYSSKTGYTFTYNNKNRLINIIDKGYGWTQLFTLRWDNDKLISVTSEYESSNKSEIIDYTVTYNQTCKKGYFPFSMSFLSMQMMPSDDDISCVHPELFGIRTKQLPARIYGGPYSATITFAYEFDKEGYISKITTKEEWGDDENRNERTWLYTLKWD